jgi:hypothetical protein
MEPPRIRTPLEERTKKKRVFTFRNVMSEEWRTYHERNSRFLNTTWLRFRTSRSPAEGVAPGAAWKTIRP